MNDLTIKTDEQAVTTTQYIRYQLTIKPAYDIKDEFERALIRELMRKHDNNQSACARELGLNRGTFRKHLAKFGYATESKLVRVEL